MMAICAGSQLVKMNGHTNVRHNLKVKNTITGHCRNQSIVITILAYKNVLMAMRF